MIIPARNAAATLARTLEALRAQDVEHEVVVVDNESADATGDIARAAGARVLRQEPQRGPAAARNAGVAATSAPLLAFTDADCEPTPGWLAGALGAFADADLVTGPVAPTPGVAVHPFDRTVSVPGPSPRFETANLLVTREMFERAGGFQPLRALGPGPEEAPFGEDALFGWRARRAGARVAWAPGALVHHAVFRRGPRGYVAERARLRYFPALVREVPEMRAELTARLFLTPRSARFDLAVAGVLAAAATRRPWPLLAAAPYARRHLRLHEPWRRSAARENAAYVSADLVGLGALAYGSARARTLLL